jgi:hypothetical protein
MSDVQPPLFQSPDAGKDASQHSPSQTQGDSPRETVPDDYAAYQQWRDNQYTPAEPDQHGEFDKPAGSKVSTGRTAPTTASKSEAVADKPKEEEKAQSYVWLPNGEIRLVKDEDLPGHAGVQAQNGLWEEDGKVFNIVAVYPKEFTKESK